MEYVKVLINISWIILVAGGIIWSIFSLIKIIIKSIYTFFTKTLKIRKVNKQVVTGIIKNKKYHKGRGNSKPSPSDIPNIYELIVEYEGIEYIITTNRKVYDKYEIDNYIDLLLIEYLDYSGDTISYNLKIAK
ncbi:MAG: hypothetical protein ACRCXT_04285 [Paraclostridium sp.]